MEDLRSDAQARGLTNLGILYSDDWSTLNPGFRVLYQGPFDTRDGGEPRGRRGAGQRLRVRLPAPRGAVAALRPRARARRRRWSRAPRRGRSRPPAAAPAAACRGARRGRRIRVASAPNVSVSSSRLGQRVARVRVERRRRRPRSSGAKRSTAGSTSSSKRAQVGVAARCPAAAARSASCRAPAPRPVSCASPDHRPQRVLVQRDGEHARVLVEHRLRAVAVVHVPVDDRDAADAVHAPARAAPRSTRWPAGRSPSRAPARAWCPGGRSSGEGRRAAEGQLAPPATAPPAASSAACQESGAV